MDACTADAGVTRGGVTLVRECPVRESKAGPVPTRPVEGGITDAQLYNLIVAHFGVLAHIAIAMGIARAALDRRIKRTIELQAAVMGARRVLVRVAQGHLRQALSVGAAWAGMFQTGHVDRETVAAAGARKPRVPQTRDAAREPRLAVADAATLKLALALHAGEPVAVMFCLSHLNLGHPQPGGPYEKHRRGFPEEMFVEMPTELPVDRMPAPTVGVEIADASTAKGASAVESVQPHAESAPTLTQPGSASHLPFSLSLSSPPPRSGKANGGRVPVRPANYTPTVGATVGASAAPTSNATAAPTRKVCANPGRECGANLESRQTRLVCCAPLHTPYLPRQPSCLCLDRPPGATLVLLSCPGNEWAE